MLQTLLALIVFLFPLAYSPGPGNMFFAINGARFGFAATIPASLGYHLATWIVTAAVGLGFAATMSQFPQFFPTIRVAGSLYVLWLAWKMFRAAALNSKVQAQPAGFGDGVILLLLNPKGYAIMVLMFTQFLGKVEIAQPLEVVLITTVFTLNNLVAFSVWTLIGDKIAGLFRTPDSAKRMNMLFAGILAAVALWMLR
ncbi:MAG: lysine transporter LysE [Rhodobacterales bacterium]|nr:MAG: lysine transporter LysE [Rhodobacterales bacterium]